MITAMYRKVGAIAEDETPTQGMLADAMFAANALIKEWMALGIHVWTEEEAILFFQLGQPRYLIGGTTTDKCCDAYSWVQLEVNATALAGATQITVVSDIGINSGDNFGVVLDSGVAFWTTVSGAPSNNVVTLAAPLPANAQASAQNNAFSYPPSAQIVRPLKVPFARQIYYQGGQGGPRLTPMSILSRREYMDLPQPLTPGISTQFYYSPQLVSGEFYAWPNPQNANFGARFTWHRPLQDLDSIANTTDVPQEWLNAVMWNLAKEMAPEFDVPPPRWTMITQMAAEKLDLVQSFDRDPEPILFGMSYDEAAR